MNPAPRIAAFCHGIGHGRPPLAAAIVLFCLVLASCGGSGGSSSTGSSGSGSSSSGGSSSSSSGSSSGGGGSSSSSGSGGTSSSGGGGGVAIIVSPGRAALTTSQVQTFVATAADGGAVSVTWDVDGTVGGNTSVGTISATGLYTPPATGGTHSVNATNAADPARTASVTVAVTDLPGVFTFHNDVQRTGQNVREFALTAAVVSNGNVFGKLFSCAVDAPVYAQPLYVAGLAIGGIKHNVLFVATENDTVYAFDADATNPTTGQCIAYWTKSLLPAGATAVPAANTGEPGDLPGTIGITGTPVIGNGTLYVVAKSMEAGPTYKQRLHALDLASGSEKATSPKEITATTTSTSGSVTFDPLRQAQRPALLLLNGIVYVAFGSHGDIGPYYGWVLGYDATSLAQVAVFNAAPNGQAAGFWMSGSGPAADASGNVYVSTGNGPFSATSNLLPAAAGSNDFGESLLKLQAGASIQVIDFFTPRNWAALNAGDNDFGSGGVVVLPDSFGSAAHPHLIVAVGKEGVIYLADRDGLGRYTPSGNVNLQTLAVGSGLNGNCNLYCGFFSTPAVWNGTIYLTAQSDALKAFKFSRGLIGSSASSQSAELYKFPGASPVISASGSTNGLVWVLDNNANGTSSGNSVGPGPAILRAYDATNFATPVYSSATVPADRAGHAVKFAVPTVANGKVYVGGNGQVTIYGLKP